LNVINGSIPSFVGVASDWEGPKPYVPMGDEQEEMASLRNRLGTLRETGRFSGEYQKYPTVKETLMMSDKCLVEFDP
jgi:hypothetical protein